MNPREEEHLLRVVGGDRPAGGSGGGGGGEGGAERRGAQVDAGGGGDEGGELRVVQLHRRVHLPRARGRLRLPTLAHALQVQRLARVPYTPQADSTSHNVNRLFLNFQCSINRSRRHKSSLDAAYE